MIDLLTALAIGVLFAVGIFQLLRRNVIRSAIGLIVITNAINLFLFTSGAYQGIVAAYTGSTGQISDPLPQAMVLTAIIISMGGFSFILGMLYIISLRYKTSDSDRIEGLKH
jgi:multisubunit Na+/H+ antiporter MnhC subunit